jgi:serine/threonine protein kinase/predicted TPR repeat methyltransferase
MTDTDPTRLAGAAYGTRLARGTTVQLDEKTRIAQEGYQSKVASEATNVQPDSNEFYKVGDKIGGRYEVSAIHHGAMGVVYGCFDHETKLPRALKTVRDKFATDKQMLSMFESEATTWISLEKHPYIVRAYLVERFKNLPYVITEYVRGPEGMEGDLRGWLGHPRLTLQVAVTMALQMAQGMQHSVRKVPNLVHRDLKPANILVNGDGKAMVTDFGLAGVDHAGAGTPAYMSPEQWRGEALDQRSDIYAFGCILFEMFTSHRLFSAMTVEDLRLAHLEQPPVALARLVPNLPIQLEQFVLRCLEKNTDRRPKDWDSIVKFLAEWFHQLTGKAVVFDFSSLALDAAELVVASYSLFNLQRYSAMLLTCERAIEIDPNNSAAWSNKGTALYHLERFTEALIASDRGLKIDPNFPVAWNARGNAMTLLERYDEALAAYEKVIEHDPNDSMAWYNKGCALLGLKRFEDALRANDQALFLDPQLFQAWNNKGVVFSNLRSYDKALHAFDQSIKIDSNSVFSWFRKGFALYQLRRYEESVTAYSRALAIDPNYTHATQGRDAALRNLHQPNMPPTGQVKKSFWTRFLGG